MSEVNDPTSEENKNKSGPGLPRSKCLKKVESMIEAPRWLAVAFAAIYQATSSVNAQNVSAVAASQVLGMPYPYEFPLLAPVSVSGYHPFPMPECNNVTLEEATIDQLQHALSSGALTSTQMVSCYIQRYLQTNEYTQ